MGSALVQCAPPLLLIGIVVFFGTAGIATNRCTNYFSGYIASIKSISYDSCILEVLTGPANTSSSLSSPYGDATEVATYCTCSSSPVIDLCYNRFTSHSLYRAKDKSHVSFVTAVVFFVVAALLILGAGLCVCIALVSKLSKRIFITSEGLPLYERQPSGTGRPNTVSLETLRPERPSI